METQSPTATTETFPETSDLSKLCLPQEYKDTNRRLAWANSICFLFLVIGLIGLKPQPPHIRALSAVSEPIPVEIIQPEEPVKPPTPEETVEPEPTDVMQDQPVVATVVAVNSPAVAFAVPTEGPVILAPVHAAAPPPREPPRTIPNAKPSLLTSAEEEWGGKGNKPNYPALAQRLGYRGTVILEITFGPDGAVMDVKVSKSSGYTVLDNAAAEKVRNDLRLKTPPGEVRVFTKSFTFTPP